MFESVNITVKQNEILSEPTINTKALENQIAEESNTEIDHYLKIIAKIWIAMTDIISANDVNVDDLTYLI